MSGSSLLFKMKLGKGILKSISSRCPTCQSGFARQAKIHTKVPSRCVAGDLADNSSESLVLVDHYQAITLLGLNRPAKRNALNIKLIEALRKELATFQVNTSSSVAVLYGTGGNFCAGLDLDDFPSGKPNLPLVDEFCCKPVIASINGYAVGEGFDLALACDVRISDDHAILGFFNRRFGVPISTHTLQRLSAIAGFAFTLDVVLTGRPINADEAFKKSIMQMITSCGASKGEALTYAQCLTKYPQEALRSDRAALFQFLNQPSEMQKAIEEERKSSLAEALKVMPSKCQRFSEGIGKHGSFKQLTVQDRPEWMK